MKNKPLTIHVLASDGSPLGVTEQSIFGQDGRAGVGGAELAILTLMRSWHDLGHSVTFYNDPTVIHGSAFKQLPKSFFNPRESRDILIVFRSPNKRAIHAVGKKIWFSTDQYTVGDFKGFAPEMDEIVTISNFHADYFKTTYGIENTTTIDLPVRTGEYDTPLEKVKNSMIFCSVPDRGLLVLADCYDELKNKIPDLTLTITSDYRLWGATSPMNEKHIRKFIGKSGVRFLGAINRTEMIAEQMKAEIHAYPCTYDELFCYASAECQVAGCYPITSSMGALRTTNMGIQIDGNPTSSEWKRTFINEIVKATSHRESSRELAEQNRIESFKRFSISTIQKEWDKLFYGEKG